MPTQKNPEIKVTVHCLELQSSNKRVLKLAPVEFGLECGHWINPQQRIYDFHGSKICPSKMIANESLSALHP